MLTGSLHQRTASRYARRAQIGFVTLGVGATALAAFALRTPEPVEPPVLTVAVAGPVTPGDGARAPDEFDASAVDRRLRQIGNYPEPKSEEYEPDDEPEPTPADGGSVKFLGALKEPTRLVALLKFGERQRLLGPGESDGDVTVSAVHEDRADIMIKGVLPQTLKKQPRSGPTVTYVAGGEGAPMPGGGNPGFAGNAGDGNSPAAPPGGRGRRNANNRANPAGEDPSVITAREAAERARAKLRESIGERP